MLRFLKVFFLGFLFIFTSGQIFAHSQTQVIEMTENGFEPSSVEVDTNSTLIFINKDKNPRWPASNIHPTHGIYPEFDPKMQIEPGKDWTFKPKKAGTFKYHDHLYPHLRATLIVEEEPTKVPVKPELNIFNKIKEYFFQFLKVITKINSLFDIKGDKTASLDLKSTPLEKQFEALEEYSRLAGAQSAWEAVQSSFKSKPGSMGNIHDLAHLAGKLLYEEKGFEGIALCKVDFAFGCYHGFLDTAFSQDLSKLASAQDACSKLGPGTSGPVSSCIHGIGHGIASFYSTSDLKSSLSECRKLTVGKEYCFDGVFMEFVRSAPDAFFKREDPLYPCNDLENNFGPIYSFSCGRNQPSLMMSRFKIGFEEVISVCLNANSKLIKQACFDSLGFSLASSGDEKQIIQGCQRIGEPEFVLRCAKAASGELIFQEVPGWEQKSAAVCQAFPEEKDECLAYLDRLIKDYGRVKKITFNPIKEGEDPNTYLRREIKVCYDTGGRDGCYKQIAQFLYPQLGLSRILKLLKENEQYPEVYARCHEVTHYLSRLEYEKQKEIAKVYAQCDSTCHGGCYHGTLEAYLQDKLSQNIDLADHFPKVCGVAKDYDKPLEFNECLHGMGHAAMFTSDMELKDSLKLCDSLGEKEFRERCYSGVFMENSSSSTSTDHQSKYLKADDPFYPCNSLDEKYQPLCWQYQSSYFAILSQQDFTKVANMCLQIPQKYQDKCFKTIGTNQVGYTSSIQVMKDNCSKMPSEEFKNTCVSGVISSLSYRFVGDLGRMIEFCSLVDPNNKESCFRQIGTSLKDWSTDKSLSKQNCNKIPNQQESLWCLSAI